MHSELKRELGFRDITLMAIACIVGTRWIPAAAHAGAGSVTLWFLAAVLFLVPLAIAVAALSVKYPGTGGLYLWTRNDFGRFHGFLCFAVYWIGLAIWFPSAAMFYMGAGIYAINPALAADGDPATRWCADGPTIPQWWQVDLGKPEDLTGIRIVWERDGIEYQYKVEGSEDGRSWTMLSDQTKSHARDQQRLHPFLARGIRHVRVTGTGLHPGAWASIVEVEVHGTQQVPARAAIKGTLR